MNPKRLAEALNTIAMGFAEAAEAIKDDDLPGNFGDPLPKAAPAANPQGEGHLLNCPKHHVPYTDGQYGPYCKQATDDPAWGKQKGDRLWCRITPQNAADYLRIKAAA